MSKKTIIVGIAGNPNSGKTTIFNELTGSHQKVGNYPGVTVEKLEGERKHKGYTIKIYDLPGTYSLTSYSIDELVARDFIINEKPDLIVDVMDSTNLERHLYLAMQIQEFGIPLVGILNMTDEADQKGISIDEKTLGALLGMPMAKTVGKKGDGLETLLDLAVNVYENTSGVEKKTLLYGTEVESQIEKIVKVIESDQTFTKMYPSRWIAVKLLEKDKNVIAKIGSHSKFEEIKDTVHLSIKWIENHFGRDSEIVITEQKYGYIHGAAEETVEIKPAAGFSLTEKIDKVLLNRYAGLPIFLVIMWGIFQATFKLGEYPMGWLETIFGFLGTAAGNAMSDGLLKSLVVDGIIGGVGGMLTFLPNVLILFFFISILEDTGYMSRIAFLTDRFLHRFGLHGQSFIAFVTGFGCTIPAIMSARTLKNDKDRLITILVTSFFSCGARLPVYVLLISAFFPESMSGNILFLIYMIGIVVALLSALLFRKTIAKGQMSPFVMELPPYRMPAAKGIFWHIGEKCWFYVRKAGTLIVAASIVVWFITTFPQVQFDEVKYSAIENTMVAEAADTTGTVSDESMSKIAARIDVMKNQEALEKSYAGQFGKVIEPVLKPIGFDWKIGVALVTGFAAKEVVVSTMGVLYKVGSEGNEENESLRNALVNDPIFNPLVAFVLMIFTLLYVPCFAALAIIKQELGKWRWVLFSAVYCTGIAWVVSFIVYQTGRIFIGG